MDDVIGLAFSFENCTLTAFGGKSLVMVAKRLASFSMMAKFFAVGLARIKSLARPRCSKNLSLSIPAYKPAKCMSCT